MSIRLSKVELVVTPSFATALARTHYATNVAAQTMFDVVMAMRGKSYVEVKGDVRTLITQKEIDERRSKIAKDPADWPLLERYYEEGVLAAQTKGFIHPLVSKDCEAGRPENRKGANRGKVDDKVINLVPILQGKGIFPICKLEIGDEFLYAMWAGLTVRTASADMD
jgi:hypothetical protein